jgi:hypothetical protein
MLRFSVSKRGKVIPVVECRRSVRGAVVWECWLIVQDAADRCHYTFSLLLGLEKLKSLAILHQLQKESFLLTYINFIKLLKAFKRKQICR